VSGQPNLVTTVAFPIRILAVVSLLVAFVQAGISTIILLCFQIVFAEGPHLTILLVPVVLLPLCLLVLGLAWLLSALGVFVPDAGQVVPPFIAAMMFLNPIFYPISQLPDWIRPFAEYSPLAFSIDAMRQVVVFGQPPRLGTWLVALAIGGFVALLGYTFFARTQKGFADVL
jgi:lipopolysaccharide transport system permease protein